MMKEFLIDGEDDRTDNNMMKEFLIDGEDDRTDVGSDDQISIFLCLTNHTTYLRTYV